MIRLMYDGTFDGLLTAVFEIYNRKVDRVNLEKGEWVSTALFEDVIQVVTNEAKAGRVLKSLKLKLSSNGIQRVYIAHMAGLENEDNNIAGYIRHAFDSAVNIEEDYGNRYVMRVSEIVAKIRREKRRLEMFTRFEKLMDDTLYASIEPAFNILPLLIRHFKNRYADNKWIIYDAKRGYGLYYNLHDVEFITLEFSEDKNSINVVTTFGEDDGFYRHLLKNGASGLNDVNCKHTGLYLRPASKKYWKHLPAKI